MFGDRLDLCTVRLPVLNTYTQRLLEIALVTDNDQLAGKVLTSCASSPHSLPSNLAERGEDVFQHMSTRILQVLLKIVEDIEPLAALK